MLSSTSSDQILETDEKEIEVYWQNTMEYYDEPETVEETPIISNKRKTESKLDDLVAINPKKMQLDVPTTSSTNNDIDFHYHKCSDDEYNSTNSDIKYRKKQIDNVFDLYAHNCVNRLLKCDILDSIKIMIRAMIKYLTIIFNGILYYIVAYVVQVENLCVLLWLHQ